MSFALRTTTPTLFPYLLPPPHYYHPHIITTAITSAVKKYRGALGTRMAIAPSSFTQLTVFSCTPRAVGSASLFPHFCKLFAWKRKMLAGRYLSGMYRVGVRAFSTSFQRQGKESFQFLVVGAGAGGLSISSTFCRKYPHATAIIEPSEVSFFCCSYDISPSSFERNIFEEKVFYTLGVGLLQIGHPMFSQLPYFERLKLLCFLEQKIFSLFSLDGVYKLFSIVYLKFLYPLKFYFPLTVEIASVILKYDVTSVLLRAWDLTCTRFFFVKFALSTACFFSLYRRN